MYTQLGDVLYQGMSGSQVESLLGGSSPLNDRGSVWDYPEDSEGNTLSLFVGATGLRKWTIHKATLNQGR